MYQANNTLWQRCCLDIDCTRAKIPNLRRRKKKKIAPAFWETPVHLMHHYLPQQWSAPSRSKIGKYNTLPPFRCLTVEAYSSLSSQNFLIEPRLPLTAEGGISNSPHWTGRPDEKRLSKRGEHNLYHFASRDFFAPVEFRY